jgi:hypothetical protein
MYEGSKGNGMDPLWTAQNPQYTFHETILHTPNTTCLQPRRKVANIHYTCLAHPTLPAILLPIGLTVQALQAHLKCDAGHVLEARVDQKRESVGVQLHSKPASN